MTEMHDLDSALQDLYIVQSHPERNGDAESQLNQYLAYIFNRQAIAVFERKEYKACLVKLEKALSFSPNDPAIIKNRAEAYYLTNELDKALQDFVVVHGKLGDKESNERISMIQYKQALKLVAKGKYREAIEKLDASISRTDSVDLYYERARVYFLNSPVQDLERCRSDIAYILERNPDHVKAVCLSTLLDKVPFMPGCEPLRPRKAMHSEEVEPSSPRESVNLLIDTTLKQK
jgi:tetratricopeptide (TPR) repeat protein